MKIGILTLPIGHNYGGIIQAWALQQVLKRMGHQSFLIELNDIPSKCICLKYPWRAIEKHIFGKNRPIRRELIELQQKVILSQTIYYKNFEFINSQICRYATRSLNNISKKEFDTIIIGSDQIWRPVYARHHYKIADTFGKFAIKKGVKTLAYAASFGIDTLDEFAEKEKNTIKRYITKLSGISVREKSGLKLCRQLGAEAQHVLDPTLLLEKEDYLKLIPKSTPVNSGIMTYILDSDEKKDSIANEFSKQTRMPIFSTISDIPNEKGITDWLAGFRDAELVITDSFHACVFSIIFRKAFAVIPNNNRGSARIESLLKTMGLENNLVSSISDVRSPAEYRITENTVKNLQIMRESSLEFLKHSLNV